MVKYQVVQILGEKIMKITSPSRNEKGSMLGSCCPAGPSTRCLRLPGCNCSCETMNGKSLNAWKRCTTVILHYRRWYFINCLLLGIVIFFFFFAIDLSQCILLYRYISGCSLHRNCLFSFFSVDFWSKAISDGYWPLYFLFKISLCVFYTFCYGCCFVFC